jgi:hypothetical protein
VTDFLASSHLQLLGFVQKSPIIVRIVRPERNEWRDLLVSAGEIIGIIVLAAVVLAVVLGGTLFWIRSRRT